MKKFLTIIALAALTVLPAQAQLKFGVKGGLNVTQLSFKDLPSNVDTSNKTGFFVGPTLKVSLPLGLGLDVAGLYDQRDAEIEGEKVSQKSINVPVNLRFNIGLGSLAGIYLAAGPQVSFNVGDDTFNLSNIASGQTKETLSGYRLRDSNFSVNLGAGVSLLKHLEVGFIYNIAVGKTGELRYADVSEGVSAFKDELSKSHAHAWQISAAYYF